MPKFHGAGLSTAAPGHGPAAGTGSSISTLGGSLYRMHPRDGSVFDTGAGRGGAATVAGPGAGTMGGGGVGGGRMVA